MLRSSQKVSLAGSPRPATSKEPELKASAPLVRRYQFVNNLIRYNQATKLREEHKKRPFDYHTKPPDNCQPSKIPFLTQKEVLTEKVSKLLGHATFRDRQI